MSEYKEVSNYPADLTEYPNLLARDGELYLLSGFYPKFLANRYYEAILPSINWQAEQLFIYGRWLNVPRLMAWYGDNGIKYRYSGVEHVTQDWTPLLRTIKSDIEAICLCQFNSVMINLYRDGQDSMGCHADNEKELGKNPVIASLSLGETRLLRFKHQASGAKLDIELAGGDLLIMAGAIQHHWQHELPKTRKLKQPRINLTFRRVYG